VRNELEVNSEASEAESGGGVARKQPSPSPPAREYGGPL